MSTPIKPPGSPPSAPDAGSVEGGAAAEGKPVEAKPGELDELVESTTTRSAAPARAGRLEALRADLAAGRVGVDEAIDRLVARAMSSANGLPPSERAALEAQLRTALNEDPTLIALRKDLERGSHT